MARILFVLAHQDDEIAVASRIRFHVARGDSLRCVYLTNGASRVRAAVRNVESLTVLERLGVRDVAFHDIDDGTLPDRMPAALRLLERENADEVVTLAYEGGHQDHDAAHLVGAVFAKQRGVPCREMPLYNGNGTVGPLFRVMHPIGDGWTSRRIARREKFANALLCRFYRSQRMTWLGLMPLLLVAPARELIRDADLARASSRPHPGRLFYERRFHYPYDRFAPLAQSFLREAARD